MKRIILAFVVVCLLFCGCTTIGPQESVPEHSQTPTQIPTKIPTESPIDVTTAPETETVTPPSEDKVTVYLVERTDYYDSGYAVYNYDENYNIVSYDVFTIENDPMYSAVFSEHNTYGMPCKLSQHGENWILSWFEDWKIKEAQEENDFTGYQYEYDQKGDIVEKRGYYEGILQDTIYFEYDGSTLSRVYCVDFTGAEIYELGIKNGVIVEKIFSAEAGDLVYSYEYDENGYLIQENCISEGQMTPVQIHTYKAVEVDAECANYILAQQNYLLSITWKYMREV